MKSFFCLTLTLLITNLLSAQEATLDEQLITAVDPFDQATVAKLIEAGANPNYNTPSLREYTGLRDRTPLILVCAAGNLEAAKFLVEAGAEADKANEIKRTPLFYAVENGNLELVKWLVDQGANLQQIDDYSFNLICWAAKYGHLPILNYMIEKGLPWDDFSGYRDQTPLMAAAEGGHFDVVKKLVEMGSDVTRANPRGQTPLMGANNPDVIRYLVKQGADLHAKNEINFTATVYAIFNQKPESLKTLLELGANPEDTGKYDAPLLQLAMRQKDTEICTVLVNNGAEYKGDVYGKPPFVTAASQGMLDFLKVLKSKGLKATDYPDALISAAQQNHLAIAHWLLSEGVPIDHKNARFGQTALFVAVASGQLEMVEYLLNQGAEANTVDKRGSSALERAQRNNYTDIAELLKKHGAE